MEQFSTGSCIRFGWETFKKRPWFFIGVFLVYIVILGVLIGITLFLSRGGGASAVWWALVRAFVEIVAGICTTSFFLKAHDHPDTVQLGDLFSFTPFWSYVGTSLIFAIVLIVGLILVVIPGVIWAVVFGFATYVVIDQKRTPIAALKESARLTKDHRWEVLLLLIVVFLFSIFGLVCFFVGILVTGPVTGLALVRAYRTLQHINGTSVTTA